MGNSRHQDRVTAYHTLARLVAWPAYEWYEIVLDFMIDEGSWIRCTRHEACERGHEKAVLDRARADAAYHEHLWSTL